MITLGYLKLISLPDLSMLSESNKDRLIIEQWEEIKRLREEVNNLKKSQNKPKKTSKNSSIPPSKDFKSSKETDLSKRMFNHSKGGRKLSLTPSEIRDFKALKCLECNNELSETKYNLVRSYDKVFLPEVKIETVRVNIYECVCDSCNKVIKSEIPEKYSNKELLSANLKAMIMYLHYENYVSYERIVKYFKDIYGLEISEGLVDSVIKSSISVLSKKAEEIKEGIRNSDLVCSDETSARVKGKTYWQWVFQNSNYCYHTISPTRGAKVKEELFGDKHPKKYVSDAFSSQKVGIKEWQVCLSHQIRDCNYLIELDNNEFALKMKELFQYSIKEKDSPLLIKKEKKKEFLSRLEKILKIQTPSNSEANLRTRFTNFKDNLFMFLDYDNVPPTNNSSEQALRPSVIFRKVTNGFRSENGKDIFANFRTVIDTAKKQGRDVFDSIINIFTYNKNNTITI